MTRKSLKNPISQYFESPYHPSMYVTSKNIYVNKHRVHNVIIFTVKASFDVNDVVQSIKKRIKEGAKFIDFY